MITVEAKKIATRVIATVNSRAREAALLFYVHQAHRPDALAVWLGRIGAKSFSGTNCATGQEDLS